MRLSDKKMQSHHPEFTSMLDWNEYILRYIYIYIYVYIYPCTLRCFLGWPCDHMATTFNGVSALEVWKSNSRGHMARWQFERPYM